MVASVERRACQTAPLWPRKVPILRGLAVLVADGEERGGDVPVAGDAVAQHGVVVWWELVEGMNAVSGSGSTLAGGDQVVLVIFDGGGEVDMRDWTGVSVAGQRDNLGDVCSGSEH